MKNGKRFKIVNNHKQHYFTIKKCLLEIFYNLLRIFFYLILSASLTLIYVFTYEFGKSKKVTKRKIRRVKFFNNVKHFFKNYLNDLVKVLELESWTNNC